MQIGKLLEFIVGREPVASATGLAGLITALLAVATAFGLPLTTTQIGAIGAAAAALAGFLARKAVTPVRPPAPEQFGEAGGIPLALLVLIALGIVVMLGLAFCGDALFNDEDEVNDVGLPALVVNHECDPYYEDCGYDDGGDRYGDGRGGYSGGPSGGYYEGGKGGSDYDGDGDGDRCRNLCFYGVPYPGQPGTRS